MKMKSMPHKRTRSAVTTLIVFSLLLSTLIPSSIAYADEIQVDGDMTLEEGAEPFNPTPEEEKMAEEKNADVEQNVPDDNGIAPRANTWRRLSIPAYKQSNGYYCGPATVKEVVQFHKGSSASQSAYAKLLGTTTSGTDMSKIAPVLCEKTGRKYILQKIEDKATWKKRIIRNIKDTKLAVVMDIATTKEFWRYKTSGHFLPIRGYAGTTTGVSTVEMADPHPTEYGINQASADNTYRANNSHWRQSMIW